MKRLNINFLFLILAVISLLFLEGGLLFRVFGDYLGENLISSLIGVICMQCGFFAISLNSDTNEYKIPPQWLFVIFGQTLLVCYNIYHVIELLPTLKSNGLPQFIIGIATGLFVPFLGGLLLDLLAAKMKKIEDFKVWKDTLYQLAKEESKRILGEKANFEKEIKDLCDKRIKDIEKLLQEINDIKQKENEAKMQNVNLVALNRSLITKHDAIALEFEKAKTAHANDLLKVTQEKGKDSGELGRLKTLNGVQGTELAAIRKKYNELDSLYKDSENRATLLEGVNDTLKDLRLEIKAKDLQLNDLSEKVKPMYIYEYYIKEFNRLMRLPKEPTEEGEEDRYTAIENLMGKDVANEVVGKKRNNGNK